MTEMKSAWERAMERADKLGKLTEEELKQIDYIPRGNALAARYLHEEKFDLDVELTKYKGQGIRQYVIQGVQEILMRNIQLPHNEQDKKNTLKAMAGIKLIKESKNKLDPIYDRINNLLSYYEQARQQTFAQFKKNFESGIQETVKSMQQRPGAAGRNIEAEIQVRFQEEWRRVSGDLDSQYEKALEDHKKEIAKVN
jgi:hypothetical protein